MTAHTFDIDDLDARDALFNAYFDGELSTDARDALRRQLEDDDALRDEYDAFVEVVHTVQGMPYEFAPDDFVQRVQGRIRTRSRGRFFAEQYLAATRIPYEVIALVMLAVMAAAYLLMEMPHDRTVHDPQTAPAHEQPSPSQADPNP